MKKIVINKVLILGFLVLGAFLVTPYLATKPVKVVKKTILKKPALLPGHLNYSHVRNSNPLVHPEKGSYCSSVNVKVKNSFYTLTNAHCCMATAEGKFLKEVTVKGSSKVRNVLRIDELDDICVLDNPEMQGVKISTESVKRGDTVTSMGYPLGGSLRIFKGEVLYYKKVTSPGCDPILDLQGKCPTRVRTILKIKAAPGSSGSPVYNNKGELVGLLHVVDIRDINRIKGRMITLNQLTYQLYLVHNAR